MDFKKLFENNKAVSPVIGVILMVAITVILAAAIGSSVFGQGTTESAPQANLDVQKFNLTAVKIEHLGGDPINFDRDVTKVMLTIGTDNSNEIDIESIGIIDVGDVNNVQLKELPASDAASGSGSEITVTEGSIVNIKFIDKKTNQIICDKNVRF